MMWLILGLIVLSLWLYVQDTGVHEEFSFSGDKLNIEVSGCKILIKEGSNDDVTAFVSAKRKKDFFNSTEPASEYFETEDEYLKMLNPVEDIEACSITLESARYPELNITCTERLCEIE
jgi:hypothetical protein